MSAESVARFHAVAELDSPVAEAMLQWGLALADTKHRLGRRLSEWINGAPALEAAVGMSAMTQDELGHARSLFAMLRDLPGAPPELKAEESDLEDRLVYFNPALLDTPWASWLDVIAVNVLLDRALSVAFDATRDSQFGPLRQRAGKVLQEEQFHRIFGDGWLARLAASGRATRDRLQAALERVWPVAAGWFGPPDDPVIAVLLQAGIVTFTPDEMRSAWLEQVNALLQKHGFAVPAVQFDWSTWEAARRQVAYA